jgi:putative endonuclease
MGGATPPFFCFFMYIVYLLQSIKFKKLYIGFTSRKMILRLQEHNRGQVSSTRKYKPWKMVYCEVYLNSIDARDRESKLKEYGSAWGHLKKRIVNTLKT